MNIVLSAPVKTLSGYGARSRDFASSLIELGLDVSIIPTRWGDTPDTGLDLENPKHKLIHERLIGPNLQVKPDVWIQCTIPNEFTPIGNINIGLTAGIETTICKPEWIDGCNRMDLVLVSSEHSKRVFVSTQFEEVDEHQRVLEVLKLNTPIEVLFEGFDTSIYKRRSCTDPTINSFMKGITEQQAFLFVGHWLQGDLGGDRKDIGMLIHTFYNTFKKKEPQNRPALILKTSHANFSNLELLSIQNKIQTIGKMIQEQGFTGTLPSVYLLHGELSDDEMNSLYNHDKVMAMVSFTKGEGYGRPLGEFTLTGKPVIAPNWSGQIDFLNPEFSWLLPGQITQVHPTAVNDWIMGEGGWFTINYTYASQIMESCFKMYDKFLDKSKKHINITKNNFSMSAMTKKIGEIFDKLQEYKSMKQTIQPELQQFKLPTNLPKQ